MTAAAKETRSCQEAALIAGAVSRSYVPAAANQLDLALKQEFTLVPSIEVMLSIKSNKIKSLVTFRSVLHVLRPTLPITLYPPAPACKESCL